MEGIRPAVAAATARGSRRLRPWPSSPCLLPLSLVLLGLCGPLAPTRARGEPLPAHSFAAPFNDVHVDGKRYVST